MTTTAAAAAAAAVNKSGRFINCHFSNAAIYQSSHSQRVK